MEIYRKHKFEWTVLIVYVLYLAVSLLTHEPWRDEAQSYLLVKNLSFIEMLGQLRYEGHPAVWYLILFPFIKLGCPVNIQNVISAVCAGAAVYLLLFHAPLKNNLKLAMILTSPIIFNYSVIGRSYCLVLLFVFVILVIFNERYGRRYILYAVSLGILVNTALYAGIIAGAFLATDIIMLIIRKKYAELKSKEFVTVFLVFALSAALMLATIYPDEYYSTYLSQTERYEPLVNLLRIFYRTFMAPYYVMNGRSYMQLGLIVIPVVCLFAFVGSLFLKAARTKDQKTYYAPVFFCIFTAVLCGMVLFTERFGTQHGGIFLLVFWAAIWILILTHSGGAQSLKRYILTFSAVFVIFCLAEPVHAVSDIIQPYSGSRDASAFLIAQGYDSEDTLLITPDAPETSSMLLYLDNITQVKSPDGYMSFVDWRLWRYSLDKPVSDIDFEEIAGSGDTYNHVLIIVSDERFGAGETLPYEQIYSNIDAGEEALHENYRIYKLK